jgi:hypothetical protein
VKPSLTKRYTNIAWLPRCRLLLSTKVTVEQLPIFDETFEMGQPDDYFRLILLFFSII